MIEYRGRSGVPVENLDRAELARRYGRAAAYGEEAEESAAFWLRLAALLFIVALLALFASYTLSQVTTRSAAERILGRAVPEMTDFDHAFSAHFDELQTTAASTGAGSAVALPDYPLTVTLSSNEIVNHSPAEVRHTLLLRTADTIYDRGMNAFAVSGKPVSLGTNSILSGPWAFKAALRVLNPRVNHDLQRAVEVSLVAVAALGLVLLVLGRGYNRIVMYGVAVFVAAIPGLALGAIVWLLVQVVLGASSDPLVAGASDITRDLAWYAILSFLVFTALGAALFVLGLLVERLEVLLASRRDPARARAYREPA